MTDLSPVGIGPSKQAEDGPATFLLKLRLLRNAPIIF